MNVFVTGGAGYIGSVCTEELLNAGHQVTVYDNLTEGHRSAVDPRAEFIPGQPERDGEHPAAIKSAKPEAMLHFAANALVGESMTNPGKYFHNNVVNGLNLLDAAVECGVKKFVFSSTCATYGPPDRVPMTEDLPQRPINPYGESKLMFEKMLHLVSPDPRAGVRRLSLFQRRRRQREIRRTSPHRDAPHPQRPQGRAGPDAAVRDLRHGLSHARRHVHSRLHPHRRPGAGAHPRPGAGQAGLLQSRQWRRLFRPPSHRDLRKDHRQKNSRRGKTPPPGRPAQTRGRRGQGQDASWAGNPNIPSWTTSSPPPGAGIRNIRTVIRIERPGTGASDCGFPGRIHLAKSGRDFNLRPSSVAFW